MNSRLILFTILLIICIKFTTSQQEYAYTVHYVKAFRQDKFQKYMGCGNKNIIYGTYIEPHGPVDALYIHLNQGMYMNRVGCQFQNMYFKLFGTAQNYDTLIATDPKATAEKIVRSLNRGTSKFIVDWKYPSDKQFQKSRTWLNNFVNILQTQSVDTYVKAPASMFCRVQNGLKYLLDLDKPKKFIIEMYGQQAGVYTTYQQMFQKQVQRQLPDSDKYIDLQCPKFPSYKTLSTNYSSKQFFIEKTLQKQQAGFIGPRFAKFLDKAKFAYNRMAFLDTNQEEIIQL